MFTRVHIEKMLTKKELIETHNLTSLKNNNNEIDVFIKHSMAAELLRKTSLIIWDECLCNIDFMLRQLTVLIFLSLLCSTNAD